MDLYSWGWADFFAEQFEPFAARGWLPARVVREDRERYGVVGQSGELVASAAGRLRLEAQSQARSRAEWPAVGDWVAIQPHPDGLAATIHAVLARKSRFSRRLAGETTDEQVVAANVDVVWIVAGLDGELNPRRLERYLTLAWESGAQPVLVLNKLDACPQPAAALDAVRALDSVVPVHAVSATHDLGLEALRAYLVPGQTLALLGSSGVGKSSLINRLLGVERQEVGAVREDDRRGRHTTTRRELLALPGGALIIDTPGMRALQLWGEQESLGASFADIEGLARQCRFSDCQHRQEPGCAVRRAIAEGRLEAERLESYRKLEKELRYLETRQDQRALLEQKAHNKQRSRWSRQLTAKR